MRIANATAVRAKSVWCRFMIRAPCCPSLYHGFVTRAVRARVSHTTAPGVSSTARSHDSSPFLMNSDVLTFARQVIDAESCAVKGLAQLIDEQFERAVRL